MFGARYESRTLSGVWSRATLAAVRLALVFAALLAQSCRCSSSSNQTAGSGSGGSGEVAVKAGSGSAPTGGSAAQKSTLDIQLPVVSGKPPIKTTAPVPKAQFDKLIAMEFPGFKREATTYPTGIQIRQRTVDTRPKMSINVYVVPCDDGKFKCVPMKLEAWKADEARLKDIALDKELHGRPDTVFQIEQTSIGGVPAISVYQAAHFSVRTRRATRSRRTATRTRCITTTARTRCE